MRIFTAIPLPRAVTDRLSKLCSGVLGAKWADPDQMHITLRFIGEVDGPMASDIAEALDSVSGKPLELDLATIGHCATGHRLRTLWVGVAESPGLEKLQFRVDRAVSTVIRPTEARKFHAHVTLGRFKRNTPNLGGIWRNTSPSGPVQF